MIELELASQTLELGGTFTGSVRWTVEGKAPGAVLLGLAWTTSGRGDRDAGTPAAVQGDPSAASQGTRQPFELPVPPEGPPSYAGQQLTISWEVHGRLVIPWGIDEHVAVPVIVLPVGLAAAPGPAPHTA